MMFSIALTDGTDKRLMFCGYHYVEDALPGEPTEGRRTQGPALWVRTERKRGVWVGDFTGRRPSSFVTYEQAVSFMDEILDTHPAFAGRLLIVNATTGEPIVKANA